MIPYEDLAAVNAPFAAELKAAAMRVIDGGWYILGKAVEQFEHEFAADTGTPYCAGVASGLDALVLALDALQLPPASEVIVPSNTYIATILAVLRCGHRPVLVEPDPATCNLDPACLEAALTPRTRAVMPVHLYGKLCDMAAIMAICDRRGIKVVEDCAQAHGAAFQGRKAGSWGHINAFSFYPTKNLGALGDGGAVTTADPELHERVRKLRNYGSTVKYHNDLVGYNSRLDELQAALLSVKLRHLDDITAHKTRLAEIYFAQLPAAAGLRLPLRQAGYKDVFHIFNVRLARRDALREHLRARGIGTEIHYPVAPHRQAAMRGILSGSYPLAEEIHATTLSLPISFANTATQIEQVAAAINEFMGGHPQ
jgi:dTDP-4-amino-4,6-dideoxygalactose transaminase